MNEMQDKELIGRYAGEGDGEAFTELVRRHGDWVYSSARRQVGDEHLAEDVSQAVFVLLARKAGKLVRHPTLGGWLFGTLTYCVKAARREREKQKRLAREAAMQRKEAGGGEAKWEEIAPVLDAAVGRLRRGDREVVLLRFYERKGLAQIGEMLGVSEDAAQKRVERAVERLREVLRRKGVGAGVGGLSVVMAERVTEETAHFRLPVGDCGDLAKRIVNRARRMMIVRTVSVWAGVIAVPVFVVGILAEQSTPASAPVTAASVAATQPRVVLHEAANRTRPTTSVEDQAAMQGRWGVVRAEHDGKAASAQLTASWEVVIQGDEMQFNFGPQGVQRATFVLNASQLPKWIDLRPADYPEMMPGIYELRDGELLIVQGNHRPPAFDSKPRGVLYVLRRNKLPASGPAVALP